MDFRQDHKLDPGKATCALHEAATRSVKGETIIAIRSANVKTQKRRKKGKKFVETYDFEKGGKKIKKAIDKRIKG